MLSGVVLFSFMGVGACGPADPGPTKKSEPQGVVAGETAGEGAALDSIKGPRSFRGALAPMPWYDRARDDYRRYDPEAIGKEIPKERPKTERAAPGRLSTGTLRSFVYVFLFVVGAALLFFLVRAFQERRGLLARRKVGSKVRHRTLVDELQVPGIPLEEESLIHLIEAALHTDPMRASVLLFIYCVLMLGRKEVLTDVPHATAREAVRALNARDDVPSLMKERFATTARNFEQALYGGRAPEGAPGPLWEYWKEVGAS